LQLATLIPSARAAAARSNGGASCVDDVACRSPHGVPTDRRIWHIVSVSPQQHEGALVVLVVLIALLVVLGAALVVVAARTTRTVEARGSTRAGAFSLVIAEGAAGSLALVVLLSATIAVFAVVFIGAAAVAFKLAPRALTIATTAAVAIAIEIAPTDSSVRRALGCARGEDVAIGVIARGDVTSGDANAPPPLKPMMSSACDVDDDDTEASALHNARMSMSAEDSVVAGAGGVALDERPPPRLPNVASENSTLVSFRSPTR